jgi:hypothetical protein
MTGRMPYYVGGHHRFAGKWSDNVPINHPVKYLSPTLFRVLMPVLLVAQSPAMASAQAVLEISSPVLMRSSIRVRR